MNVPKYSLQSLPDINTSVLEMSSKGSVNNESISVAVHDNPVPLHNIWNDLQQNPCYVFQRYEFILEWCNTVAPALGAEPKIYVVYHGTCPLMIIPMCIVKTKFFCILEFIDGGVSDYNAPVLSKLAREAGIPDFQVIWKRILDITPRVDGIRLRKMPTELFGVPNPMLTLQCRANEQCGHYLDLENGFEKARSLVKEAAKKKRQLLRSHELVVREDADRADVLKLLIKFRSDKYKWNPRHKESLVKFLHNLLGTKLVKTFDIRVDGRVIAAQYAFVSGEVFTGTVIGYDPAWADFSPGKILLSSMISSLREKGFAVFDSGYGDEPYKKTFSSHRRDLRTYSKGMSVRGTIFLHAYWLARTCYRAARMMGRRGAV